MGRRPGDIQRTLRQMHTEDLLVSSDPKPVRGTFYWFNEEHAEDLEAALEVDRPAGQIAAEQRLLALVVPEDSDPYPVLGRGDLNGPIAWVVEWGGEGELLVALSPGTPQRSAEQLVRALRDAGVRCTQRRTGEVIDGGQLRRDTVAMREARNAVRESEESTL